MRPLTYRYQRTIANSATVSGKGLITGASIKLRFRPAPANSGLVFLRTDIKKSTPIPAHASSVTDTRRRTTLGQDAKGVTLIEHVMAALSGMRVDNCVIELDGPEPPGLDGSAGDFARALANATVVTQTSRKEIVTVSSPITVCATGATITIHPAQEEVLRVSYVLDYGTTSAIPRQSVSFDITPEVFLRDLADCRTFLLDTETEALKSQGVGLHLTTADVVVFGARGVIGNTLRFADEPARHKVLDLVGDLALSGCDLAGHVVAYRSGHQLNVDLAKRIEELSSKRLGKTDSKTEKQWSLLPAFRVA